MKDARRRAWAGVDSLEDDDKEENEDGPDSESSVLQEEGGVKKIIYNGTTKKRTLFDDDDNYNQQWNYNTQQNGAKPGQQFNLDDVWSIKKNVGVNKAPVANPAGGSFWERGAGKGYYSRHGGIADEDNSLAGGASTQGGTGGLYQQNKSNYSYSYAGASPDRLQAPGRPTIMSPRGGITSAMRPGTMNNGFSAANGSMMPNGHATNMGPTPTNMGHSRHGGPVSSRYQGPVASKQPRKF